MRPLRPAESSYPRPISAAKKKRIGVSFSYFPGPELLAKELCNTPYGTTRAAATVAWGVEGAGSWRRGLRLVPPDLVP